MSNVINISKYQGMNGSNGGEPPMDNSDRLTKLELKLETLVPTLATKEDLTREILTLRAEMHKEFTAQTWRIIGAMLTFGSLLSAAVFFITKNAH